jgi:hypothetical protein
MIRKIHIFFIIEFSHQILEEEKKIREKNGAK